MLSQLGPYLIDEELAQGGMARVFRARLRGLGGFEKTLVIKQIRPELANDPRFVELFVREANTLVSLSHPHIVPVYELGAAEGTYYLSMEYVEGATVAQMLEAGPLAPALVAHLGAQICEALEYAHSRFGILHRDLTPRNIIVDQAGHARLVDFGIAASGDVVDAAAFGSPGYMSPEQAERRRLSPQSDLFSLGAVLYEALSGEPAFEKTGRPRFSPPPALNEGLPAALRQLVHGLLALDPAQRPDSARVVARALRAILARENPHGAIEEMQRRVRAARPATAADSAVHEAGEEGPNTARIEARAIATSPVLTEMLRSSGLAKRPTQAPADLASPKTDRAPEPATQAADVTRPLPRAGGRQRAISDTTNPQLTTWLLRLWPVLALLSLVVAVASQRSESGSRAPASAPARPSAAAPRTPRSPAPATAAKVPEEPPAQPARDPQNRAQTAATPPAAQASGSLSVNARPWADVSVDGKHVGTTPLRKLKLKPGVHTLSLVCPPLGRATSLKLDIAPARAARVVVDLGQNPPRTILDGVREAR